MNGRTAIITALAVTILGSLYLIYSPSSSTFQMSDSKPAEEQPASHYPISGLEFKLSQISKSPPSLLVTLKNTHWKSTYTVLKWDTPLDPIAPQLGVFKMVDADTGEEIGIPRIMVNRMLPPPRDALQEVAAGTEHAIEVVFDKPWMPEKKPAKYKIKVQGTFRAVWEKAASEISDVELEGFAGPVGKAITVGGFKSEEVVLTVE
ncbi:hypothetical protein K469DRAFT_267757 [Zopfia rhizophila CBS 207.26]|uniref:Uncharacterized protein n=1 Tax=Zopfia rhizophila CBS 207.26 TaxID=1314779 RepID=A0A6A6DN45_9PEZI|nr:hypothetical protein K469DRAFT_267757 [Zopfia rhizophila CBS 207.26]